MLRPSANKIISPGWVGDFKGFIDSKEECETEPCGTQFSSVWIEDRCFQHELAENNGMRDSTRETDDGFSTETTVSMLY